MNLQEQIISLEEKLRQSMLKSDVKELDALISDELIFTDHTGRRVSKSVDMEAHQSGNLKIESIKSSEQEIKTYDQMAIVSVLMSIEGKYLGEPFHGNIRFSRTWLNLDDSWKIVAAHSTLVS